MDPAADSAKPQAEQQEKQPWHLDFRELKDVIVGELAERGEWVVANVQTSSFWPINAQKARYRGETFWIIPIMRGYYPAVAMKVSPGKTWAECERLIFRFLSALSWVEERGFMIEGLGGGSLPVPMGREKDRGLAICEEFDFSYFPEPESARALVALALMREGRGLNHPAYAFLSFFRVLEVAFPGAAARKSWVSDNLASVEGHGAAQALTELSAKGISDIGAHLYESGRCAVAHAAQDPIVDPDDPSDMRRMRSELPIMAALARKAIEDKFGVETRQTIYRKHLYELKGFKEILGAEVIDYLTGAKETSGEIEVSIPEISVQIRKRAPYEPLSRLSPEKIGQSDGLPYVRFVSPDRDVAIRLWLDFAAERLNFSLFDDVAVKDAGTAASAEHIAEVLRFQNEYFANGQLHIVNADTGDLIARKDAYIPENMFLNQEAADAEIAHWKRTAEQRRNQEAATAKRPNDSDAP